MVGLAAACQNETAPTVISPVVISEIMYHPVLEEDAVDNHEFIELANRTDRAINLTGHKIAGGVRYTFPPGTTLAPRGFVVVARNRERLMRNVPATASTPAGVAGDYEGELDNDKDQVVLLDPAGAKLDEVHYRDGFPWPTGPDALGAADDFLPPRAAAPQIAIASPVTPSSGSASIIYPRSRTGPPRRWIAPRRAGPAPSRGTPPALVLDLAAAVMGPASA